MAAIKSELAEVKVLAEDSQKLTHYYLSALVWIAFYGAVGLIYFGIFSVFAAMHGSGSVYEMGVVA